MVGFARLITDYVTFAYLEDVYVLPEYQGKGLGRWMMTCMNEIISAWPDLRRLMLIASNLNAARLYQTNLGARDVRETEMVVMDRKWRAGNEHAS